MSRKHYIEAAEILRGHIVDASSATERATAVSIARELAVMFKRDNGAFDYGRFYAACGVDAS